MPNNGNIERRQQYTRRVTPNLSIPFDGDDAHIVEHMRIAVWDDDGDGGGGNEKQ